MNINMSNSRYLDLFGRDNITNKLNGSKTVKALSVTGAKPSEDNSGLSVSISKESKAMLRQLSYEKEQKALDALSETKFPTEDSSSLKKEPIKNTNSIIIEGGTAHEGLTRFALLCLAARKTWESSRGGTVTYDDINGVVSAYEEMRKEVESQYTGKEQERQLKMLDDDYDKAVEHVAEGIKNTQIFWASMKRVPAGPHRDLFRKMNFNFKNSSYMDDVKAYTNTLKDSLIRLGELAKQYIIDGNAAPNTEDGRKDFADYINRNAEANDSVFSLDELRGFI